MNLEQFKEEVVKLGLDVSDDKISLLEKYYDLLVSWNEKMNLTAITEKKDVYLKHFYDSLTIIKVIDLNSINTLCDIGTGAGFPGLVLKIFFPHLKVTLIDSLNKRINFLNVVIKELNLKNIIAIHARAEEFGRENREIFDVAVARAVSSFNVLLEYCMPLVKTNKFFISMRGQDDDINYSNALKLLSSVIVKKELFNLPYENSSRTIILVKKENSTNDKYPRRFSEIKKKPL